MIALGFACVLLLIVLGACRAIGTGHLDRLALLADTLLGGRQW